MKRCIAILFCLFICTSSGLFAQKIIRQSINPFGSSFSNSDISISQTAGQSSIVGNSFLGDGKAIRQGFQQPKISTRTLYHSELELTISVYPNPFQETFYLELDGQDISVLFNLSNALGQVVFSSNLITNKEYSFNQSNLSPGIYFISIYNMNNHSRLITKKITKTI
ncbi:MAG: T9SS type A sorting domain-containing protein [Salinivirgaceae bacterium]|jgi:hypothetical protein|nr:T9SS type A sorting domain-containing protein [Salinivirgaceae bacterium]